MLPSTATWNTATESFALQPVAWNQVHLAEAGFWGPRLQVNREVTLGIAYEQLRATGRLDAFKLDWQPGQPGRPHEYWDSDVAKWVEAVAYSLATHPDADLQAKLDQVVDLIASAQQPDGYLNTYFTVVAPEKRWTHLLDMHELYCAGHLMEAAVAVYQATGQRKLLAVMCRYADLIDATFGPAEEGKRPGYCGHEEIELALIKLYRATGETRYLQLSRFFLEQRGQQPCFFEQEAREQGRPFNPTRLVNYQAHLPVLEQQDADGHAVRAMYLYSGLVDLALATDDAGLRAHARRLWRSVVQRRMYLTGGVGSTSQGEQFTFDYDLPNETAYAETCAAVGLVFFAHRLLQAEPRAEYADVVELALYNGILSGVNLRGDRFFYANPLRASAALTLARPGQHVFGERQPWFDTSCCPPNLARLLASLGGYLYATDEQTLYVHQYLSSQMQATVAGAPVALHVTTSYPWEETIALSLEPEVAQIWTLALRIPGWCQRFEVRINGAIQQGVRLTNGGYLELKRLWQPGDQVVLQLAMPVQRQYAHPACRMNLGRVALRRGPVIYCLEEVDLGFDPSAFLLPPEAEIVARWQPELLGGAVVLEGQGLCHEIADWPGGLYSTQRPAQRVAPFRAVPYALWCNRQPGSMLVWMQEAGGGA